jgi:NADPH-dependent F420 reductase
MLAFLGGTGALGSGLALRFAAAGEAVLIGSRVAARAEEAARRLGAALPGARIEGCENREAVERTDRLVLAIPFGGLEELLAATGTRFAGKLVIDAVVPLAFAHGVATVAPVPEAGSVGELLHQRLPRARVVSAFKTLPAGMLGELARPLAGDVLLCGEDQTARAEVGALIARLPGLRAVEAGGIISARGLEALAALLINVNRRYRTETTVRILGVP